MSGEDEDTAGPWQDTAAGEDENVYSVDGAEVQALDGELMPPAKVARPRLSGEDEQALAERIRTECDAGERSAHQAVKHFRKCGDLLLRAKAGMAHGYFGSFLDRVGIKPRSAQVYMRLAREMPRLPEGKANRVAHLSLRDAIAELSRTSGRAAKLSPTALTSALLDARREPLKQAVIKAANAKHCVSTPAPQLIERPPTDASVQAEPLPMPPHVASLMRAIRRAVRVYVESYSVIDAEDACWALNEVYCSIQDGGLSAVSEAAP